MRRRLLGSAAFVALAWLAAPQVARGVGSGEDDRGPYGYGWVRLRFARSTVELHYWSERQK